MFKKIISMFKNIKTNVVKKITAVFSLALFSASSMAADPDYTGITGSIDLTTVIAGIMAIAAVLAGLYVVVLGVKKLLAFLRTG